MKVFQGYSLLADGRSAVAEATEQWGAAGPLDLLIAFASTRQDPEEVAAELSARYPGVPMVGCTTAGELLGAAHHKGSLVVVGLRSPGIRWSVRAARDLAAFDAAAAARAADDLLGGLRLARQDLDPAKHFCVLFIDGLSCKEEVVASYMADALDGIPLVGGSAGDDLKFQQTHVFFEGHALGGAAVMALAESTSRFEVVKHQHYTTTPKSLVITRADTAARRVYEMDGYPAIEAYAAALGLPVDAVTSDVTFLNPLTFVCDNHIYVRSIQRLEPDGSIVFYCAIEEGMVLSLGGHEPMAPALTRNIADLRAKMASADLFLSCNCILRALEADKIDAHAELAGILSGYSKHVIGFDTYGEQLSGLHINQTLVGLALHDGGAS